MRIIVHGIPAPQGSKRHVGNGVMVESSAKVKPWREAVKWAALEVLRTHEPFRTGPVTTHITFYLPRPQSHYGTGRNATTLKPSAPTHPYRKPDFDKLLRSTLDGLSDAGVWSDDAQSIGGWITKEYADKRPPGADVELLDPNEPQVPF